MDKKLFLVLTKKSFFEVIYNLNTFTYMSTVFNTLLKNLSPTLNNNQVDLAFQR